MFRFFRRAAWLGCCIGVVMSGADALANATFSLKAVKKNGVPIAPTNDISVVPGDTITAELRAFGWGHPKFDAGNGDTGLVRTYQAQLDGRAGVQSSGAGHGLVLPDGWDAPLIRINCPCNVDPNYPVCNPAYGCVGPTFNPTLMASITTARPDFILSTFLNYPGVAVDSLDLKWGATIQESNGNPDGQCAGGGNAGFPCALPTDCPSGTCQLGMFYGGTLNLVAKRAWNGYPAMCGDFTFRFTNSINVTFINNPLPIAYSMVPILEPLVIHGPPCPDLGACCVESTGVCTDGVLQANCQAAGQRWGGRDSTCATLNPPCQQPGACCVESTGVCTNGVAQSNCQAAGQRWGGAGSTCATLNPPCIGIHIVSSDPAHCAIDARVPWPQGQQSQKRGFQTITLTFDRAAGATEDSPSDYTVQQFPPLVPTVIQSVVIGGNDATITFTLPILPKRWTCVMHNASQTRRCLGFLPADANGDRTSAPVDILEIIDNLNGVRNPPLAIFQCDIDRSALCAPADILTEIDLLNGASGYPNYNGSTLDACPSTTGP